MKENDKCHKNFFPMLRYKAGLQVNESWSKNKLTAVALIKVNFKFTHPVSAALQISIEFDWLHQCWSYRIRILLYLGSVRKKLLSPKCSYFTCNKFKQMFRIWFNLIFLFTFLSKNKSLYIGSFIDKIEMYYPLLTNALELD